ncbi:hypothetical protein RJ641_025375 [Dillenia turbinata]|uniref:DUF8040 domain-containing protein n=1 Tax=Dillenia turbinata TaxID=194707 RepID=A0AAN8W0R8_9MAGN
MKNIFTKFHAALQHVVDTSNETRCYEAFRMTKIVFIVFCQNLQHNYGLNPPRGMSIYEEVGICLITCAHYVGNRLIQEMFNHYGETIHKHFYRVLGIVNKLVEDIIKPHPHYNDRVGYHMSQNKKYLPFFKNCIGAIIDTHIKARLPSGEEIPYIGRFLAPYRGENIHYHLEDFLRARTRQLRQPRGVKEKFNFLHLSYRNIIECTFGVWKAYFLILGDIPYYPINVQTEIVLATMVVHNYIHKKGTADNGYEIA